MKRAVHWMFEDRTSTSGRLVFWQWPNLPLWVFIVAAIGRRVFSHGALHTVFAAVATIALLVWAGLEVAQGVNPFRRILGGAIGLATIAGLLVQLVS